MNSDEARFEILIHETLKVHPDWLHTAIRGINSGVHAALEQAARDSVEWETLAMNASEARLFKSNKSWLATKIEKLSPRASMRWDHIIEGLRK